MEANIPMQKDKIKWNIPGLLGTDSGAKMPEFESCFCYLQICVPG